MGSSDGTRDVAATAPTTPLEDPGSKTTNRSPGGGGYGQQARRHLEADGLVREGDRPDPIAQPAPGGAGEEFWGRSNHTAG